MLAATPKQKKTDYVVKFGYVYSDAHGNHYKAGEVVALSQQEYELSRHRVIPFVSKEQLVQEGAPRKEPVPSRKAPANIPQPHVPVVEEEKDQVESANLTDVIGRGKYEIK